MAKRDHQPRTAAERLQRQVNVMIMNGIIEVMPDHTSYEVGQRLLDSLGEPERIFTLDGDTPLVWRA